MADNRYKIILVTYIFKYIYLYMFLGYFFLSSLYGVRFKFYKNNFLSEHTVGCFVDTFLRIFVLKFPTEEQ